MTTTHYGSLSSFRFADEASDLRGTLLYGRGDEKLGTIDDVIFDHTTGRIRYAVVDTGGWLRHRRFMVPADRIRAYEKHEDHFYADLTRQQVESFPPYDAKHLESEEAWSKYEQEYQKAWKAEGNVMHRDGSDHNITPTPDQMPAAPAGELKSAVPGHVPEVWPERIESPTKLPGGPGVMDKPQEATATSGVVSPWSSQNRWEAFQGSLNRHLPDILKDCKTCGPDQRMQQRSVGQERKVS